MIAFESASIIWTAADDTVMTNMISMDSAEENHHDLTTMSAANAYMFFGKTVNPIHQAPFLLQ